MILWIILIILVILVLFIILTYNGLVTSRNKVKDQFSQIDVQLKKRSDLIPSLVEIVKGYAKHEKTTFEEVAKLRSAYLIAKGIEEKEKVSSKMETVLSKILAISEAYPELKADSNFMHLQGELKDVEDKIAYARQFYNDSVLMYNNKRQTFPNNLIASLFGFKEEKYFEANDGERDSVEVNL